MLDRHRRHGSDDSVVREQVHEVRPIQARDEPVDPMNLVVVIGCQGKSRVDQFLVSHLFIIGSSHMGHFSA